MSWKIINLVIITCLLVKFILIVDDITLLKSRLMDMHHWIMTVTLFLFIISVKELKYMINKHKLYSVALVSVAIILGLISIAGAVTTDSKNYMEESC